MKQKNFKCQKEIRTIRNFKIYLCPDFMTAPAVDGPGSADAIADAKCKTRFSWGGLPRGPPTTQLRCQLWSHTRRKIFLILCIEDPSEDPEIQKCI